MQVWHVWCRWSGRSLLWSWASNEATQNRHDPQSCAWLWASQAHASLCKPFSITVLCEVWLPEGPLLGMVQCGAKWKAFLYAKHPKSIPLFCMEINLEVSIFALAWLVFSLKLSTSTPIAIATSQQLVHHGCKDQCVIDYQPNVCSMMYRDHRVRSGMPFLSSMYAGNRTSILGGRPMLFVCFQSRQDTW